MSEQVIHVRVNDAATGQPTPVRIRFTGPDGEYIAPFGRLTHFPTGWNEDVGGSVVLASRRFAYIDGTCEIRLPAGPIEVEISKGPEYIPLRHHWDRKPGQISLRLNIQRQIQLQNENWFSGDTEVFFLSPEAAWLEGAAEGLNVVNVLAAQWNRDGGEFLSNILEFSGQSPAHECDDCIVAVNTQNRHAELGSLSLLNCHRVVYPLAANSADFPGWTLADWCNQCHRKGGLVVWPSFPESERNPLATQMKVSESRAELLEGHVDAIEWTHDSDFATTGISEWYRLLNAGRRIPLVGGSAKASNATAVGAVRTYAQLETEQPFSYGNWIEAIRAGRTFVTAGPIVRARFANHAVIAESQSVTRYERLQLVVDGQVTEEQPATSNQAAITMSFPPVGLHPGNHWIAARCLDGTGLSAHTSPIYFSIP